MARGKKTGIICFLLLWQGFSISGICQPGDPGTDPDVPISGIEILIGLGGLLGAKKIFDAKRKKN